MYTLGRYSVFRSRSRGFRWLCPVGRQRYGMHHVPMSGGGRCSPPHRGLVHVPVVFDVLSEESCVVYEVTDLTGRFQHGKVSA